MKVGKKRSRIGERPQRVRVVEPGLDRSLKTRTTDRTHAPVSADNTLTPFSGLVRIYFYLFLFLCTKYRDEKVYDFRVPKRLAERN